MNVLLLAQRLVTYLAGHPREAAILSLVAALTSNWALGTVDAIVRGDFSFSQWPRILRTQLASTEAKVIGGMLLTAALTAVGRSFFPPGAGGTVNLAMEAILDALAAASALYSAALWSEVVRQLRDIEAAIAARLAGLPPPLRRNRSRLAPVAPALGAGDTSPLHAGANVC